MSNEFDPYYKWLGIPRNEQPPHFYRLLGIALFEADEEVITIAAEQRILLLQSFQKGEYALISQKLQKKILAIKAYLLDPEKKAEYDTSLRLQLRHQPAKALPVATPMQTHPAPRSAPRQASPPAAAPSPILNDYLNKPSAKSGSDNPLKAAIVAMKESLDLLFKYARSHKRLISLIMKLGCAALVVVIILMVFAHGKALWTFTFDKTSYLSDKFLGSSDAKPPDRQARIRNVPGSDPANTTNSADKQPTATPAPTGTAEPATSGTTPPAPDAGATAAAPAPETPETAKPSHTEAATSPPCSEQPAEITSLALPSGKIFSARLFRVNLVAVTDLIKNAGNDDQVLFLDNPLGRMCAFTEYKQNNMNGIFVSYYENRRPMTYATYADGSIDGFIKTWNEKGEHVYWCQYAKGVRDGFCCFFKNNSLRLLLEIDHDTISSVHLCTNGKLDKSFTSLEQASADKNAKTLLAEITDLETDIKDGETYLKKTARDESQYMRRERKAATTSPKRNIALQGRLNLQTMEKQMLITNFWQYKGW
jgi:hypothetical protein